MLSLPSTLKKRFNLHNTTDVSRKTTPAGQPFSRQHNLLLVILTERTMQDFPIGKPLRPAKQNSRGLYVGIRPHPGSCRRSC